MTRRWRRKSRRVISDDRSHLQDRRVDCRRYRGLSRAAPEQVDAALHHLRQRGRWQIDAHRPPALRFEDDLRRPARRARERQQEGGHAGAGDRLRPAGRRACRRARARHHDRCRLSLFRDREAQVHRRRLPGTRAIYPQHGDRCLDRRLRRDPDRCAQGRAGPDKAPQFPVPPARHQEPGAGGQQDGPDRLRSGQVRRDRRRLRGLRQEYRDRELYRHPDVGPCGRQHYHALGKHRLVRWPGADRPPRDHRGQQHRQPGQAFPHARAVGQSPQSRLPRLLRPDRHRHRQAG